jgi:hypothetical protein
MEKYFESTLISSDGKTYRVDLFGENYIGLNAAITGGSGSVFYLASDWTDYIEDAQTVLLIGDVGTDDVIASFTYNSASDRTEITLTTATYGTQTSMTNYVGGTDSFIPVFNPKIIDLETEWQDVDDYIVSPLMPSETTINYANVQEDRTSVNTAFFDRFVESYLQSDDDELKVAVYLVDGTATLEWAGNLVVDLIEWSNESSPREYTFRAIDGINRLKNVFYEGDLNSLAVVKVIDVIKDVLDLNGLKSLWSDTDGYIAESIEYESPDVTSVTTSDSILDYTYIPENLLIPKNTDNSEVDFMTGYDVLYGILELFSCKMVHTEGRYWITQVRNYDGTQFIYRLFNKANNTYSVASKTHLITNLRNQALGKFTYFFGINRVSIDTERSDVISIGGDVDYWFLQSKNSGTERLLDNDGNIVSPAILNYNVGKILSGNGLVIDFTYSIYEPVVGGVKVTTDLAVNVYITDGNKFIKGNSSTLPYWAEDTTTTDRFWVKTVLSGTATHKPEVLTFDTPDLPFDMDDAVVTLEFISTLNGAGAIALYRTTHPISRIRITAPVEGGNSTEKIYCENTNTKFTKNLELGNLIINEGNALITTNTLSVHTNYNTGGTATIDSVKLWDGDFPVVGTLSTLRVLEAMSLQFRPIQRYLGGFVGDYSPVESVSYNDKIFVCKRVIKSYGMDENNGDWFESASQRTLLTSNKDIGNPISGDSTNEGLSAYIDKKDGIGKLDETLLVAASTSMVVNLTDDVKIGDTLNILNYETKEVLGEVVVTANASAGDAVTVSIESFTPVSQIPAGYEVVNAFKKLNTSEVYRFKTVQHDGTMGVPTIAAPMLSNEVRYVGGDVYIETSGSVYKLTGTVYVPE